MPPKSISLLVALGGKWAAISARAAPAPPFSRAPAILYLRFIHLGSPSPIFWASSSPRTSRPTGPFSRAPCAATGRREKEKERDPESPPKEWKYFSSPLAPLPLSIPHLTSPARRRQEPQGRRGALPMQAQLNQSPMPLRFSSLLSFLLPLAFRPPHAPHRTRR